MINVIPVIPDSVQTDHVTLVFDGPCNKQLVPGSDSSFGPVGNINDRIKVLLFCSTAPYREAQIKTNQQENFPSLVFNDPLFFSGCIGLFLVREPEQVPLIIMLA